MGDLLQEAAWDLGQEWNYEEHLSEKEKASISEQRLMGNRSQANRQIGQARGRWVESRLREMFPELLWSGKGPDAYDPRTQLFYEVHSGSLSNEDIHCERKGMFDVLWRTIFF